MGLEKVTEDIRRNAEKEAGRIVSQGKEEAEKILNETRSRISERKNEMKKERDSAIENMRRRSEIKARLERNNIIQNTKKEMIDTAYSEFLKNLSSLKGREREGLYKRMFSLARKDIPRPKAVYVPAADVAMAKKLFKGIDVRKGEGSAGIILESADGKEFVDLRMDTLSEMLKARTLKKVSEKLFGG